MRRATVLSVIGSFFYICAYNNTFTCMYPLDTPSFFGVEFDDGAVALISAKVVISPTSASLRVGNTANIKWSNARYKVIVLAKGIIIN